MSTQKSPEELWSIIKEQAVREGINDYETSERVATEGQAASEVVGRDNRLSNRSILQKLLDVDEVAMADFRSDITEGASSLMDGIGKIVSNTLDEHVFEQIEEHLEQTPVHIVANTETGDAVDLFADEHDAEEQLKELGGESYEVVEARYGDRNSVFYAVGDNRSFSDNTERSLREIRERAEELESNKSGRGSKSREVDPNKPNRKNAS